MGKAHWASPEVLDLVLDGADLSGALDDPDERMDEASQRDHKGRPRVVFSVLSGRRDRRSLDERVAGTHERTRPRKLWRPIQRKIARKPMSTG
jgi:hypothetical protein